MTRRLEKVTRRSWASCTVTRRCQLPEADGLRRACWHRALVKRVGLVIMSTIDGSATPRPPAPAGSSCAFLADPSVLILVEDGAPSDLRQRSGAYGLLHRQWVESLA